jgi:PAS domain S-box-containing protein
MIGISYNTHISRLIWLLTSLIFVADLLLPRHYDVVFAYSVAHFMAVFFREKNNVILLAVVTSSLTLIGVAFKPHDAPYEEMLLERVSALVVFWAAAFFVLRFIMLREEEERQESRFKALFEYATSGILMTNRKGSIVLANPAVESLFGYNSGEMLGITVESLIPTRFSRTHESNRQQYHKDPQPRNMGSGLNLKGLRKDGSEFPVEVSLSPFRNKEGEFVVAFLVDNTSRRNYEQSILKQKHELATLSEALQELNEGLENKVADRTRELEKAKNVLSSALDNERELGELKSRFLSMASHEFRTPLTSVLSSAGLVHQYAERKDIDNIKKHAERIKNAVNGLNSILTEFLSLGRLEEGRISLNREDVVVQTCMDDILEGLEDLLKPGQKFEHIHTGSDSASIDCTLTKNILINLVSNAIKYSPEGVPIVIESHLQDHKIKISVRDQGIGIPASEQKHMFDRFFRASNASNSTQGTGLGLYIVQRYVEMMGGTVGFESAVEEGSVFWVEFDA